MDLDNIKKTWQETEIKPTIDNEKIQKMISNEGRSAFNSLLRYEKIGIILLIICIPMIYALSLRHTPVIVFYIFSVVVFLVWQVYKFKKLRGINLSEMGITEISSHFYWYRKAILKEFVAGLVWIIFFSILFGYFELFNNPDYFYKRLIIFVISVLIGLFIAIVIYKMIYWNNIKKMEISIREIQEFEKDNK
jgi:hypothetical protein